MRPERRWYRLIVYKQKEGAENYEFPASSFFAEDLHQVFPSVLAFLAVNLHITESLNKAGIIVIHDFAVTQILGCDFSHFLIGQSKIPNVDVLFGICDYHFLHFYLVLGAPCVMIKEDGICRK
ncbi:hypothetical protein HMPREF0239_04643 [Clostridium sp. ATCC BAA-442]|nr:hypothetical protein HMPREF0239_04643 [Clostridium sp. ATCC BAA-442]